MNGNKVTLILLSGLFLVLPAACRTTPISLVRIENPSLRIEFNDRMHSRVVLKSGGQETRFGEFSPSETVTVSGREIADFSLTNESHQPVRDRLGSGTRYQLQGSSSSLVKELSLTLYDDFPDVAVFEVQYTNVGKSPLQVERWTNHRYQINTSSSSDPPVWSYQAGSYQNRPDWVVPLKPGFKQDNFQGMNATDYGGGTPISDLWRRDGGIAVGHLELTPKQVSLPVAMPDSHQATLAIQAAVNTSCKPGQTLKTLRTFLAVHQGDYFQSLVNYRRLMIQQGLSFKAAPADAFEPIWCAWGYGRNVTMNQVYGALPVVKELGLKWVTLDDGWQTAEGDWDLDRTKFPNGDSDMKALVNRLHAEGFKAQLWWAPLAVDPETKLIQDHPDYLLLNADGSRRKISWWDSFYLCPALPQVREGARRLVTRAMRDWGFDGLKIDGQHLNAAPPCYNPVHQHGRPEDAFEEVPGFFQAIYETALSLRPNALIEICPCGTAYSFFTMPYMNMSVASDPESSWQIRLKGKTLKALMGNGVAYFGDHVDMSDGGEDFASTVGVGGVVGTNFTWPPGSAPDRKLDLTPEKQKRWAHWIKVYRSKMLPHGEYLGTLYDLGFDRPEAHAIRKGQSLYYAFYAADWNGQIELRGLGPRCYRVLDYTNNHDLGTVYGPRAVLDVRFKSHLLIEARPE
ncbi:MAG: glycoside hydrolase family 36 protein [Acidobacteriota bacterium]